MKIRTAPTIQLITVARPGASSVTSTKGTGSQLRLRNNTAPTRALAVCSAAEGAVPDEGGTADDDIARKLIVEQAAEEFAENRVECGRPLEARQMAGVCQHLEPRAANRRLERAHVLGLRDRVLPADDEQRRYIDRGERRRGVGPFHHRSRRTDHALYRRLRDHPMH